MEFPFSPKTSMAALFFTARLMPFLKAVAEFESAICGSIEIGVLPLPELLDLFASLAPLELLLFTPELLELEPPELLELPEPATLELLFFAPELLEPPGPGGVGKAKFAPMHFMLSIISDCVEFCDDAELVAFISHVNL